MLLAAATHAFSPAVSVQEMLQSASKQGKYRKALSQVNCNHELVSEMDHGRELDLRLSLREALGCDLEQGSLSSA